MKNTLRLDHANGRIIMDRTFAKCAEDTRSEEYRHLQSVRQDYPTYTVIRKQIKKPAHKESYKGLTYDYMRTYITNHEPEETKDAVSKEFEDMIEISKCHSIRYPHIKKWFLAKYPEVAGFGVTEEKKDEAKSEAESKSEEVKNDNVTHLPQPAQEDAEYDKVENF